MGMSGAVKIIRIPLYSCAGLDIVRWERIDERHNVFFQKQLLLFIELKV